MQISSNISVNSCLVCNDVMFREATGFQQHDSEYLSRGSVLEADPHNYTISFCDANPLEQYFASTCNPNIGARSKMTYFLTDLTLPADLRHLFSHSD